jgi:signal peptidase II
VDFLAYGGWFIGNVADIAIVVAAVLIVLLTLIGIGMDGRRGVPAEPDGDGVGDAGSSSDPDTPADPDHLDVHP